MQFTIQASVSVERVQGKFASRDEFEERIQEAIDEALSNLDVSGLGADGDSEYEVSDYNVEVGR